MNHNWKVAVVLAVLTATSCNQQPEPYGVLPTAAQVAWQRMEMNMFVHFGPNTFSGLEWGEGTEPEDLFQPTDLDCRQWTRIAKEAGFGGVIITAKHHDGFCLWPNPESGHTVAQSSWRQGKGDVLRELSEACQEEGVGFGVYISPWDCNSDVPSGGIAAFFVIFVIAITLNLWTNTPAKTANSERITKRIRSLSSAGSGGGTSISARDSRLILRIRMMR